MAALYDRFCGVTEQRFNALNNPAQAELREMLGNPVPMFPDPSRFYTVHWRTTTLSAATQAELRRVCAAAAAAAVPRPPPIEIPPALGPPALGPMASGPYGGWGGDGEATPPAFQPPVNAPPAPRANRQRPILNPEDEDDEDQPVPANNQPAGRQPVTYMDLVQLNTMATNALNMPRTAADRWKLLENAASAMRAHQATVGDAFDDIISHVCRVLREEYGR